MNDYVAWTMHTPKISISTVETCCSPPSSLGQLVPFDPRLRKHFRLGGRIAKISTSSMVVQGSVAVPLRYYVEDRLGIYVEPNVWVYYNLEG